MNRPRSEMAKMSSVLNKQDGVAFLTVMMLLLILTVLGIAAITVTGFENRVAGLSRNAEAATSAIESCIQTAVNVIQQTIDQADVPGAFVPDPVPTTAMRTQLAQEILGQSDNNPDTPTTGTANLVQSVGGYTVNGDVDRLYIRAPGGGALQFAAGYEGMGAGAAGGGVEILYSIACATTNAATGTTARTSAVYACMATGESCQRKI